MDRTAQETFFDNVEALRARSRKSQAQLARDLGVNPIHLNAVWCGRKPLSRTLATKLSEYFGVGLAALYTPADGVKTTEGASDEFRPIPMLQLSGSTGGFRLRSRVIAFVGFRADWLAAKGSSADMSVIVLHGERTGGIVPDGAMVLVDESQKTIISGKAYLIMLDSIVKMATLHMENGTITANNVTVSADSQIEVIGRAIWFGAEL